MRSRRGFTRRCMGNSESRVERGIKDQLKLRYEHIGRFRDNQASLAVESESVIVRQTQCDLRSGEMIRSVDWRVLERTPSVSNLPQKSADLHSPDQHVRHALFGMTASFTAACTLLRVDCRSCIWIGKRRAASPILRGRVLSTVSVRHSATGQPSKPASRAKLRKCVSPI